MYNKRKKKYEPIYITQLKLGLMIIAIVPIVIGIKELFGLFGIKATML